MEQFDFLNNIERRTFLKILSFTGIGGLIYPKYLLSSLVQPVTRVVIVEDSNATYRDPPVTGKCFINDGPVPQMVESGIKLLAQKDDVGEAWKSLLPDINIDSIIALKVNCFSNMVTHPVVTYAVANSLKKMSFGAIHFPENNIIIYDNANGKLLGGNYIINTSAEGIRCFGTNNSGVGYSQETYDIYGSPHKLSKIVTEMADYLVNISVLKNHTTSGVSLCMKNHYGTIDDPGPDLKIHSNNCDPYIPVLNATEPIKKIQKVNIIDALLGVIAGGPGGKPQCNPSKIVMGADVVAVDYWGARILEENGCLSVPTAHYINTAATQYGLGTNDPAEMDVVFYDASTGTDYQDDNTSKFTGIQFRQNTPNPFVEQTQIEFYLPEPMEIDLSVFDSNGNFVCNIIKNQLKQGWHRVLWNGNSGVGKPVSSGNYICRLKTGAYQKSIIMQLIR